MNDQAEPLNENEPKKMSLGKKIAIGAGLVGAVLLAKPVSQVMKAVEGQNVRGKDITFFLNRNMEGLFQYWDEVPVCGRSTKLKDTECIETVFYHRTPTKEVVGHSVYDGFAFNGMSSDNIIFEREYGQENWSLAWVHPHRNKGNHPFETVVKPMMDGEYKNVTYSDQRECRINFPLGTKHSMDDIIELVKEMYGFEIDVSHQVETQENTWKFSNPVPLGLNDEEMKAIVDRRPEMTDVDYVINLKDMQVILKTHRTVTDPVSGKSFGGFIDINGDIHAEDGLYVRNCAHDSNWYVKQ